MTCNKLQLEYFFIVLLALTNPINSNLNCTVDQCKTCPSPASLSCSQCEQGYYLKTFYSSEKKINYNDCWSKNKLFIGIGAAILSSLLFCCIVWYAYKKGKNTKKIDEKSKRNSTVKNMKENTPRKNNLNFENQNKNSENLVSEMSTDRQMLQNGDDLKETERHHYMHSPTPSFSKKFRRSFQQENKENNQNFENRETKFSRLFYGNTDGERVIVSPNGGKGVRIIRKIFHPPKLKDSTNEGEHNFGVILKKNPKKILKILKKIQ